MRRVAKATQLFIASSVDGDLSEAARFYEDLAETCRVEQLPHFEGVSLLNAALAHKVRGALGQAYDRASQAVDVLASSSSGSELASAVFAKASVLALLGDLSTARRLFAETGASVRHVVRAEFLVEMAETEAMVGSDVEAPRLISEVDNAVRTALGPEQDVIEVTLAIRRGDFSGAGARLAIVQRGVPTAHAGHDTRLMAMRALVESLQNAPTSVENSQAAVVFADRQNAGLWRELASLTLGAGSGHLASAIVVLPEQLSCVLSFAAELIVRDLRVLDTGAAAAVRREAALRPERWLETLRREARGPENPSRMHSARLLDEVGDASDVAFLRAIAREPSRIGGDRQQERRWLAGWRLACKWTTWVG